LTAAGTKPPFEIHRPHLVAALGDSQLASVQLRTPGHTAALTAAQPHAPEPFANRPGARNVLSRIFFAQSSGQFPASPAPVASAQTPNPCQPLRRCSSGRTARPTHSLSKPWRSLSLETSHPLVAAFATHSKTSTQLRHALLGLQGQLYELQPSHQTREFFPRHARGKARK
jgi:hypothetical protein